MPDHDLGPGTHAGRRRLAVAVAAFLFGALATLSSIAHPSTSHRLASSEERQPAPTAEGVADSVALPHRRPARRATKNKKARDKTKRSKKNKKRRTARRHNHKKQSRKPHKSKHRKTLRERKNHKQKNGHRKRPNTHKPRGKDARKAGQKRRHRQSKAASRWGKHKRRLQNALRGFGRRRIPAARRVALPVHRSYIQRWEIFVPHHDYPAWDLAIPRGTKVRAVRAGRVIRTTRYGSCGKGVIIRGADRHTYTYCHGSRVLRGPGRRVAVGTPILRSGNTGRSTGPHLHLQIRGPNGRLKCPQRLVAAGWSGHRLRASKLQPYGCYR